MYVVDSEPIAVALKTAWDHFHGRASDADLYRSLMALRPSERSFCRIPVADHAASTGDGCRGVPRNAIGGCRDEVRRGMD